MVNPNRIAYCIDVECSAVNEQSLSWGMEGKAEIHNVYLSSDLLYVVDLERREIGVDKKYLRAFHVTRACAG